MSLRKIKVEVIKEIQKEEYIRTEDIGKNTTNKFIDTLNISNVYLGSICGDYRKPIVISLINLLNCGELFKNLITKLL